MKTRRVGTFVLAVAVCLSAASGQIVTTTTVDIGSGGSTGAYTSYAVVAGHPAVAYYNETEKNLMFARNSAADGSGTWIISVVDAAGSVGAYASLAVINGLPAVSYYDETNGNLKFARNSAADGSGTWTLVTVDDVGGNAVGRYTTLLEVGGAPAIAYEAPTTGDLKFARNSAADGSGTWTITNVDTAGLVGSYASMAIVAGHPAISYYDNANFDLKFARNSAADGSGTWNVVTIDANGITGQHTSLAVIAGNPAITYRGASGVLNFVRNSAADGTGTWTATSVASSGSHTSLRTIGGLPTVTYYDGGSHLQLARNSAADGTGTWTSVAVDGNPAQVGFYSSLGVADGKPVISYQDVTNGDLKFARNGAADASGSWTVTVADSGFQSGAVGLFTSQALVAGNPAIAYYDATNGDLRFARNSAADGSGAWDLTTVSATSNVGQYPSLAILSNGNPAVSFQDNGTADLKYARNSAPDGSGTWTVTTVEASGDMGRFSSLAMMANGNPAIAHYNATAGDLRFCRNNAADGSGSWTSVTVDTGGTANVGQYASLAILGGRPAISYYDATNGDLKFARNSSSDGTGTWTVTTIETANNVGQFASLGTINGLPAISFYDATNGDLRIARNSAADGSGTWTVTVADSVNNVGQHSSLLRNGNYAAIAYYDLSNESLNFTRNSALDASGTWTAATIDGPGNVGTSASAIALADGRAAISYHDVTESNLKWALITYPPDIAVAQPAGTNIADGGAKNVGVVIAGTATDLTFVLQNSGDLDLTGLQTAIAGTNAADFTMTIPPTAPVAGAGGSTTFTLRFAPTSGGIKTAALHIASNDPDENPFDINLTGRGLTAADDSDSDGLNDAAELQMAALGFNWEVGQTALVATLFDNANTAGLYTPAQVQALHIDAPLLSRQANGTFKLTIGVKKSTDLLRFDPFPMSAPQTVINGNGKLEFQFTVPDNAAFFRLEAGNN
jgi:hypothetical protein